MNINKIFKIGIVTILILFAIFILEFCREIIIFKMYPVLLIGISLFIGCLLLIIYAIKYDTNM